MAVSQAILVVITASVKIELIKISSVIDWFYSGGGYGGYGGYGGGYGGYYNRPGIFGGGYPGYGG